MPTYTQEQERRRIARVIRPRSNSANAIRKRMARTGPYTLHRDRQQYADAATGASIKLYDVRDSRTGQTVIVAQGLDYIGSWLLGAPTLVNDQTNKSVAVANKIAAVA